MATSPLRRVLFLLLALPALVLPASATWSIVAVNTATGEVFIASATCLRSVDLIALTPAIVVGKGGGVVQSAGDATGELRAIIFQGLQDGMTGPEIVTLCRASGVGTFEAQQYGVVAFDGLARTRTGTQNGAAASGVRGELGTIKYAIQGNVLTGDAVVGAARDAFLAFDGDLSQRVMAAMEAAYDFGGDGRCSCAAGGPTGCGSPPENGFTKSAHVGFLVAARIGDVDGTTCDANGCATGSYYLRLNVIGGQNSVDPVIQLRRRYNRWRRQREGRPDHLLSRVSGAQALPADGRASISMTVQLIDVKGVPLTTGGATLTVGFDGDGATRASVGDVTDLGDGSYSFELSAGTTPGDVDLRIVADDGVDTALLYPFTRVRMDPVTALHSGFDQVDPTLATSIPFTLNVPSEPGAFFLLAASASGTEPGIVYPGGVLPLNEDEVFIATWKGGLDGRVPDTVGFLDASGYGVGRFHAPPGLLSILPTRRLDWAGIMLGPGGLTTTHAVGFDIAQ